MEMQSICNFLCRALYKRQCRVGGWVSNEIDQVWSEWGCTWQGKCRTTLHLHAYEHLLFWDCSFSPKRLAVKLLTDAARYSGCQGDVGLRRLLEGSKACLHATQLAAAARCSGRQGASIGHSWMLLPDSARPAGLKRTQLSAMGNGCRLPIIVSAWNMCGVSCTKSCSGQEVVNNLLRLASVPSYQCLKVC